MTAPDRPPTENANVYSRRRLIKSAATAGVGVTLAGCSSVTNYNFSAAPVILPTETRKALNYEERRSQPVVADYTREVGGVKINATVESHVTVYESTDDAAKQPGAIGVVSTPKAAVMGRSFNPLARVSVSKLFTSAAGTRFLQRAGLNNVGHNRPKINWSRGPTFIAGREGTCLDRQTTLETYAGILSGDPPSVAFVHLTRVEADSIVISAAVHGRDVEDPGRSFVGPDSGYLSPELLEQFVGVFNTAAGNLRFDFGNDGSFDFGNEV